MVDNVSVIPVGHSVELADELSEESLRAVAEGEILGVWHRGYLDPQLYEPKIAGVQRAFHAREQDRMDAEPMRFGDGIGDVMRAQEALGDYLASVPHQAVQQRDLFTPLLPPIDCLRLDLSGLWPGGARLGRLNGSPMVAGTIRFYWPGGRVHPHVDEIDHNLREMCSRRRLAGNVYLKVTRTGGALEFWRETMDRGEMARHRVSFYGVDRAALGAADLTVEPAAGDLLLFDSGRIHAVTPAEGGERITASCFIGVRGPGDPLSVFA